MRRSGVARIRRRSVAQYTPKSREEVLNWLKERYPRRRPAPTTREQSDEATFYE
ncbi:MAG: hypothetical protein IPK19_28055 [Chloroflexi bacterium]|nr:hypothetical protein [Chloroflexota bacterium]